MHTKLTVASTSALKYTIISMSFPCLHATLESRCIWQNTFFFLRVLEILGANKILGDNHCEYSGHWCKILGTGVKSGHCITMGQTKSLWCWYAQGHNWGASASSTTQLHAHTYSNKLVVPYGQPMVRVAHVLQCHHPRASQVDIELGPSATPTSTLHLSVVDA